jgi:glutamine amidotransferase
MKHSIVVIDIGIGNPDAIRNLLRVIGRRSICSSSPADASDADLLILPGVGAFDPGMRFLRSQGLDAAILDHVKSKGKPLLGICLGMQMLGAGSEEGVETGLGLLDMHSTRIDGTAHNVRVPNMGWRVVHPTGAKLNYDLIEPEDRYYFAHSYAIARPNDLELATVRHGTEITAAVGSGSVVGVQFHPEKSHRFGRRLLERLLTHHGL